MNSLIYDGKEIPINTKGLFKVINYKEDTRLDLHQWANFSSRKKPISFIVIHHGGLSPHHLAKVFSTSERKVSSHLGIGLDKNGEVYVAQYLDLKHKAWHAGVGNEGSIGIDICFQPGVEWNKEYGVKTISNPSPRGPKLINDIPDIILEALYAFLEALEAALLGGHGLRPASERDAVYELSELTKFNVVGHHHITENKWDIAWCWDRLIAQRSRRNVC